MKSKKISEIMVPVENYALVSETASLEEALIALESETRQYNEGPYRHQSLVVVDANQHVVGRVSQIDIMRALEPRYEKIGDVTKLGLDGLTAKMLVKIREEFKLWDRPVATLHDIIDKLTVADVMQVPSEGEFVSEEDTLNIAMHRIVMGRHHNLLVVQGKLIVGVLRSTDVFNALYDMLELSRS